MNSEPQKLLSRHPKLVQSDNKEVVSHIQREVGEQYMNTLMIAECDTPFKYLRTKKYRTLEGQKVNLTYYPDTETVAGFDIEVMKVVRLRRS
ncbi:hypothetical protein [Shewanella sp. GXUN23E]|uniref:hypothetical protein n=1 Tax=Shewanella sp. GXUN23E TaxID=3422498 RepID=UPI003D7E6B67